METDGVTDRELIDQSLVGKSAAFGEFLKRYKRPIWWMIRNRMNVHPNDRDDVYQEAAIRLWTLLPKMADLASNEPGKLKHFVCRVTEYVALYHRRQSGNVNPFVDGSHVRANHSVQAKPIGDPRTLEADSWAPAPDHETGDAAQRLLSVLLPRDRKIVMSRMAGFKLREIGDELGVTRQNVHLLYERAMQRMREHAM